MSEQKRKSHKKLFVVLSLILFLAVFFIYPTANSNRVEKVKYKADERTITRYEFAQLLCKQYGLVSDIKYKQFYKDVPSDNKYYHSVELAYADGL